MNTPTETTPLSSSTARSPLSPSNDDASDRASVSTTHADTQLILRASILTFLFFLLELIGGHLAGSLAIMSDAAHLLSDLAGFAINLIALSVSRLPPTMNLSFGYARAEVLGAFVSILFIWALTALLVVAALERLFNPAPVNGPVMLFLGVMGLLVNIILGITLGHSHDHSLHSHDHAHHSHDHSHHSHDHSHHSHSHHSHHDIEAPDNHSHDHSHDHSHSHENLPPAAGALVLPLSLFNAIVSKFQSFLIDILSMVAGSDSSSLTVRAAYLHVLGDALQNLGVILAAALLILRPNWTFLDPICTLIFAFIVFMTTRGLAGETLSVLMEGTPPGLKLSDVYDSLRNIRGVRRVGDLHVWSISPRNPALSVHLYRETDAVSQHILKTAETLLDERYGINHVTIQVNCVENDGCDERSLFQDGYMTCISSESLEQSDISR